MPSRCCGPRKDDATSIQTSLPPYVPRSHEASRPLSPALSYHTVEPGRTEMRMKNKLSCLLGPEEGVNQDLEVLLGEFRQRKGTRFELQC